MNKIILGLCLFIISSVVYAGDGLFWAAKSVDGKIEFYRSDVATIGAADYVSKPLEYDYIRIEKNTIVPLTSQERVVVDTVKSNAVAAAIQAEAEAKAEAKAKLDAEKLAAEAVVAAANAKWNSEMEAIAALADKIEDKNIKDVIKSLCLKIEELRDGNSP